MELYRVSAVRQIDGHLATVIPGGQAALLQAAGQAAFEVLRQHWPTARRLIIFCGGGHNGGDGWVVAKLAAATGWAVTVYTLAEPATLPVACQHCVDAARAAGVIVEEWASGQAVSGADVIVDALLGIGFQPPLRSDYGEAIQAINASSIPVLALDVPSGLTADTGVVDEHAVKATVTVSFIAAKLGLFMDGGRQHSGHVELASLGAEPGSMNFPPAAFLQTWAQLQPQLPKRSLNAHKGECGHVLIIGGAPGFSGSVLLAAKAALRSGAGLVSVATHPSHAAGLSVCCPELMSHGVTSAAELLSLYERADVVVLGPGLGQSAWGSSLYQAVLKAPRKPWILDAEAFVHLAAAPAMLPEAIATPHPGEAARLLGCSAAEIQSNRCSALTQLTTTYGGIWVLKGSATLIGTESVPHYLNQTGNPGMASGGMGDALSGVIAALRAQGLPALLAARVGVCWHGAAADLAVKTTGVLGLLASDVIETLGQVASHD